MFSLAPLGKVESEGWEEAGEEDNTREVYTANRLSTYQTTDFPPKPVSITGESEMRNIKQYLPAGPDKYGVRRLRYLRL